MAIVLPTSADTWGLLPEVVTPATIALFLYIEGKIRTRSYDDQAGVKRYITEIFVDNMEMLTPKGTSTGTFAPNQAASSAAPQSQPIVEPARDDNSADDLPF